MTIAHKIHPELKKKLYGIGLSYLMILSGIFFLLTFFYPEMATTKWLAISGLLFIYQFGEIFRFIHLNKNPGSGKLYTRLGAGTMLTLSRGIIIALLGGFILLQPEHPNSLQWIIALSYTFAAISDRFDGYLARIKEHTTIMGRELDMRIDALGILTITLLVWRFGQVDVWYLLVGFSYYIFSAIGWYRAKRGMANYSLSESKHRRVLAGMQMGFLAASLWPIFNPPATTLVSLVFGIPLLITFLRDGFVMSGIIVPGKGIYSSLYDLADKLFFNLLIPGLRFLLILTFIFVMYRHTNVYEDLLYFISNSLNFDFFTYELVGITLSVSIAALGIGFLSRIAAVYFLLLMGITLSAGIQGLFPVLGILVASIVVVYGAGRYALWNPEDAILHRHDGE